ncbi:hypothetical protein Tco_1303396 [Tanacetum coccineum]
MASMGSSPFWNTGTIRPESCWENSDCWLIWEDIPIEGWMMMENKRCSELMIGNHWMGKLLKEVLITDELSIVETDKVNHIVEMDMLRLVVEVECFRKCVDEFDKVIVLFGKMQLKQEDQSYVHASNELHLHVVHVVLSEHEADQHW